MRPVAAVFLGCQVEEAGNGDEGLIGIDDAGVEIVEVGLRLEGLLEDGEPWEAEASASL